MAAIPLYKYLAEHYPGTAKSTKHFWIKQALKGEGPLADLVIFRIGRPYYVEIPEERNTLVSSIVTDIVERIG